MQDKKILTVYYSRSGNTYIAAKEVNAFAGGAIERIEMEKPYSKSYFKTLVSGGLDILQSKKPALKSVPGISSYDIIFIGAPVWCFTVPPPMMSFLKSCSFSGKTIAPFCTHGGNKGKFFEKLAENASGAKVLPGIDFPAGEMKNIGEFTSKINHWIGETLKRA
jgi:flavodoxin